MTRISSFCFNILPLLVMICGAKMTTAQINIERAVIASGGMGNASAGNIAAGWTIGEAVIQTFSSGGNLLTQGFQQDHSFSLGVSEHSLQPVVMDVFPNPVNDKLWLELQQPVAVPLQVILTNINGQVLQQFSVTASSRVRQLIDMQPYAAGQYFLTVNSAGLESTTVKVMKL